MTTETGELKKVSDYSGLNFDECLNLGMDTYKLLFRDAFIYDLKQSKEGKEYLEECWLLQQTTPDRNKLKERFGGEKND
ncbi:hypothetical protein [Anaerotignum sp.]|uniref:hypothetical protein n=1 Tax=Anaerotignum sp. TaxID=2039241 RepID=UPI00332EE046